jgi:hypothetical protein
VSVLNRKYPITGLTGRCAVVPVGIGNAPVEASSINGFTLVNAMIYPYAVNVLELVKV